MKGSWGIVETDGGFKVLARIIVKYESYPAFGVLDLPQVVNERPGQGDFLAVSGKLLVHEAFKVRLRNESVLWRSCGKEPVLHFVQSNVTARVSVLQDASMRADQFFR